MSIRACRASLIRNVHGWTWPSQPCQPMYPPVTGVQRHLNAQPLCMSLLATVGSASSVQEGIKRRDLIFGPTAWQACPTHWFAVPMTSLLLSIPSITCRPRPRAEKPVSQRPRRKERRKAFPQVRISHHTDRTPGNSGQICGLNFRHGLAFGTYEKWLQFSHVSVYYRLLLLLLRLQEQFWPLKS
jgi:hypothetical protein